MENEEVDIYDNKAGSLIKKLIEFLQERNVKRLLQKHQHALESAGPIWREYLKNRHPWLSAFARYYELTNRADSIHRHLSIELKDLASDAKQVVTMQKNMPDSIKNKYRRDLLDIYSARNYLFEIQTAWHFYSKYNCCDISWYEDDATKHPEFLVEAPGFQFNVECKRITVDIARKIHRKDFCQLADKLIPEIRKRGYMGRLDIVLADGLKSGTIAKLSAKVLRLIDSGVLQAHSHIAPFGSIALDLSSVSGVVIDIDERMKKLWQSKATEAHAAIFASSAQRSPIDPIELTVISEKPDPVVDLIKDRISNAETQLDDSKAGLILCFLESVNGFELHKLKSGNELQLMTKCVLAKDKFSHVAGIGYFSERMVEKGSNFEDIFNSTLFFRNHKCKFEKAKTFQFFSPPRF